MVLMCNIHPGGGTHGSHYTPRLWLLSYVFPSREYEELYTDLVSHDDYGIVCISLRKITCKLYLENYYKHTPGA